MAEFTFGSAFLRNHIFQGYKLYAEQEFDNPVDINCCEDDLKKVKQSSICLASTCKNLSIFLPVADRYGVKVTGCRPHCKQLCGEKTK